MISSKTIDQVMNRADIVDVVSGYISLKKAGVNYKGLRVRSIATTILPSSCHHPRTSATALSAAKVATRFILLWSRKV